MLISEIYESRQGEGLLTGTQSIFVRTSGCNLRCEFCDTPFTSWNPEGKRYPVQQVVDSIDGFKAEHVVITGGEPMLPTEIVELTDYIRLSNRHITIETAGTLFREVSCDLMSISPKLSNSTPDPERAGEWSKRHEKNRLQPDVVNQLIKRFSYQLKFVVKESSDLDEIKEFLSHLDSVDSDRVLLMPEGIDVKTLKERATWLKPLAESHGFIYCPRRHIEWYGNKRGT